MGFGFDWLAHFVEYAANRTVTVGYFGVEFSVHVGLNGQCFGTTFGAKAGTDGLLLILNLNQLSKQKRTAIE